MGEIKPKVLMLAPTPYFSDRGCHVRIYEEARALQSQGIDVRIITYHLGRDMPGIPTYRICTIPWYKKLTAGPSWHKPYLDILLFYKAFRVARSFAPDIIHAHLHEGAFVGYFLKKVLGVPMIFDCQGSLTTEIIDHGFMRDGSLLGRCFAVLERFINNAADFIITSSSAGARDLVAQWGVPEQRVKAVIDGVDTTVFRPLDKVESRRALQLPQDVPIVVFLGLLNHYQGIDLLLDAIAMLRERRTSVHFLIMGFPEAEYIARSKEMGIGDMVSFTGRIDYVKAPLYLSACDIAVSPKISLTEANGKLFNYMACGLPTVVFDTPINREILGDAGVYARFGDARDLAERIEGVFADKDARKSYAQRVREKAERDHSWQARGEALLEIYERILKVRSLGV